jgi:hypothetical protein
MQEKVWKGMKNKKTGKLSLQFSGYTKGGSGNVASYGVNRRE